MSFAEILQNTPQPKRLLPDTPLPYVFDLYWDCKTGRDLEEYRRNRQVRLYLALKGFDAEYWEQNGCFR